MKATSRSKGPTITLAICLAAGLAAGIGLARPASPSNSSPVAAEANGQQAVAPGYGTSDQAQGQPATQAQAQQASQVGGSILISGFEFGAPIEVAAGSEIAVTNGDGVAHTLTSNDGLFDTGSLGGGATGTIVAPTAPGTYDFFCAIHPSMQGTVTVTS